MDDALTERGKMMMIEKTHNVIILSLGDKILRQVSNEKPQQVCGLNLKVCTWLIIWSIVSTWNNLCIHLRWVKTKSWLIHWICLINWFLIWRILMLASMMNIKRWYCCVLYLDLMLISNKLSCMEESLGTLKKFH